MSVASLNNGSLQLSELIISNEKYSNATGYVASSSSFSSSATGTELTLGADPVSVNLSCNGAGSLIVEGTLTTLGNGTFESGLIQLGVSPTAIEIECNAAGSLLVSGTLTTTGDVTIQGQDLTLGVSPNAVTVSNPSAGVFFVDGGVKCNQLIDSTGSFGLAGQVPTANGTGGWAWA